MTNTSIINVHITSLLYAIVITITLRWLSGFTSYCNDKSEIIYNVDTKIYNVKQHK